MPHISFRDMGNLVHQATQAVNERFDTIEPAIYNSGKHNIFNFISTINIYFACQRGASNSVTDSSVLSNPVDAQNVSCQGFCGRDICPKNSA